MSLKHVLVHLNETDSRHRLRLAAQLAAVHGAQLRGVYVVKPPELPKAARTSNVSNVGYELYGTGMSMSAGAIAAPTGPDPYELAEQTEQQLRTEFDALTRDSGVDAEVEIVRADSRETWRVLLHEALCTDLVVVGKPQNGTENRRNLQRLMVEGAGPVLVLPDAVSSWQVRRVVIAWNASVQAARAVREAMPLIEAAEKVTVVMVHPGERERNSARRLLSMLRAHGVAECEDTSDAGSLKASDELAARMETADLLVAGAYGRSRVAEILTGGTTRRIIDQATIPVVMAH